MRFTLEDVDRLSVSVPGLTNISPAANKNSISVQNELHTYSWTVNGVRPIYADFMKLTPDQGRIFKARRTSSARMFA